MKLKIFIAAAVLLLAAAAIFFVCSVGQKPAPPATVTVRGREYDTEEYLVGCILAQLKNYSSADETNEEGLDCVAAALYCSLLYLYETNGLDRTVFPALEYMSREEAEKYYGEQYLSMSKAAENAAKNALSSNVTYQGRHVYLPVCRISSGALIDPSDCNMDMPWTKKLYCAADRSEPRYSGSCQMTSEGFSSLFLGRFSDKALPPDEASWISSVNTDADGNVLSVCVGGITVSGWEFCRMFGIRSVCFEVTYSSGVFSFVSKGDGDGTGMSVAAVMKLAQSGRTADEILRTFFEVDTDGV